jgi:hypothetical protein
MAPPRPEQWTPAVTVRWLFPVLALAVAGSVAACGAGNTIVSSPPSPSPTSLASAYNAAHPGLLPPGLRRLETGKAEIASAVRAQVAPNFPCLLPGYLPRGYGLASPFISTGSGAVLPNPEGWGNGYRVSYTDLRGLITVMVGARSAPGEGRWRVLAHRWRGQALASRRCGRGMVVIVRGSQPTVVVEVLGLGARSAVRVLRSLRVAP